MTTPHLPYRALREEAAAACDRDGEGPRRPVELHDVALRWHAVAVSAAADLRFVPGNVVPLDRVRRDPRAARPSPEVKADPTVRVAAAPHRHARLAWLLAASFVGHAALYLPFHREPTPMASIGIETISVEIVTGANEEAGLEKQKGTATASAPPPAQAPEVTQAPQPLREPPVDLAKVAPPRDVEPAQPDEAKVAPITEARQTETSEVKAETPPAEPVTDKAETAAAKPLAPIAPAREAEEAAAVQAVPESLKSGELQVSANPTVADSAESPPEVVARVRPPTPPPHVERRQPHRAVPRAVPRAAATRGERNRSTSTTPAATAAGGVGRGRSDVDTNYRGRVAAHLARYKQFPAEARRRGDHGRAVVTFSLSGTGSVTSVRLVSGTGVPSLDHESVAMVRRASPFPAPPDGRSVSFTVPVDFKLR